jgi:(p)ppGpp synthase/HD superfamily hydrolase
MANGHWSQDQYIKAYRFAAHAHCGQFVPGTDISYIMHLSFVGMEMIAAIRVEPGRDENLAVQCALLHDVVEDTEVTSQQVSAEFGDAVAAGVLALTKDQTLDKSLQLADSLRRIKQQPSEIWMVKLADRITNLQRPPAHWSKEKIAKYQIEAMEILHALGEASDLLGSRLRQKIAEYDSYLSPDTSR